MNSNTLAIKNYRNKAIMQNYFKPTLKKIKLEKNKEYHQKRQDE